MGEGKEEKTERELYNEALAMMETADYARGVERLRGLAENGFVRAMFQMGALYAKGGRVERSLEKAAEWYKKAAERGHWDAAIDLWSMYDKGEGVAPDPVKAEKWRKWVDAMVLDRRPGQIF